MLELCVGAWKELRELKDTDFEGARNKLIEWMAEYKAATDYRVIIVFDAYLAPGTEQVYIQNAVEVIYTRKNETADERIEKLTNDSAIAFDCPELQNKRVSWRFPIRHYYVPFRSNSLIIER